MSKLLCQQQLLTEYLSLKVFALSDIAGPTVTASTAEKVSQNFSPPSNSPITVLDKDVVYQVDCSESAAGYPRHDFHDCSVELAAKRRIPYRDSTNRAQGTGT